jgi:hypothetical protein
MENKIVGSIRRTNSYLFCRFTEFMRRNYFGIDMQQKAFEINKQDYIEYKDLLSRFKQTQQSCSGTKCSKKVR